MHSPFKQQFIPFDKLTPQNLEDLLKLNLAQSQTVITNLEKQTNSSWETIAEPLHQQLYLLNQIWGLINHLQSVNDSSEYRELQNKHLAAITDFYVSLGQNKTIYRHIKNIFANEYTNLDIEQQVVIKNELDDFKLSGIDLPLDKQARFKQIQQQLSELSNKFEQNLLDATEKFAKYLPLEQLNGVPEDVLRIFNEKATEAGQNNLYKVTINHSSYLPIMQYCSNRELRQELYKAYVTRASELDEAKFDNTSIINQILDLRKEKAQLLDFNSYADLSLYKKMAQSPKQVLDFLYDLSERAQKYAIKDMKELKQFAIDTDGINQLEAWDLTYYSEKLQQHKYNYSSNEIKQYFQLNIVLFGLFNLIKQLYNVEFIENKTMPIWQEDVLTYDVIKDNQVIGYIYFDIFSRSNKQSGAWMNSAQDRYINATINNLPIAYIICNFAKPAANNPTLLTFDEVQTIFHEMGHALHHLLTQVKHYLIAGINSVEWDAVELPSQFMEFFTWDYNILTSITNHVKTHQILPKELFDKVLAARNYHAGLQLLRQMEFAIFDMLIHSDELANYTSYTALLESIREKISVLNTPKYNRFANSFAHIFAGGYAAGYYSYKWAELLACDIFESFDGKRDEELTKLGTKFLDNILSQGSIKSMTDNFRNFMLREPQIDALLKYSGMN